MPQPLQYLVNAAFLATLFSDYMDAAVYTWVVLWTKFLLNWYPPFICSDPGMLDFLWFYPTLVIEQCFFAFSMMDLTVVY